MPAARSQHGGGSSAGLTGRMPRSGAARPQHGDDARRSGLRESSCPGTADSDPLHEDHQDSTSK